MLAIPLAQLRAHPANSNVMPADFLDKLAAHIGRTDRYPPIIVRAVGEDGYQILDGHHRAEALRALGRVEARCVVWEVDDAEALLLLATLNRLQGRDDPRKRAALMDNLARFRGAELSELAAQLPETVADLEALRKLHAPPIAPRPARDLADMPVAVHFFLLPEQRRTLEARLRGIGGPREEALMKLAQTPSPLVGVEGWGEG